MPPDVPNEDWIQRYAALRPLYESYAAEIAHVLTAALRNQGIRYHAIDHRGKEVSSLEQKLTRPGKHYRRPLEEVSDLAGVRVIVFDFDQLSPVAEICRSLFDVVASESLGSLERLNVNEFGYQSIHLVVRVPNSRSSLIEWAPYANWKAEIQIRTVLQHGWASVSHALQYKREFDVPIPLRRRLFRVAGLLELADAEFSAISREHHELDRLAQARPPDDSLNEPLDVTTVKAWLDASNEVTPLVQSALQAGFRLMDHEDEHVDGEESFAEVASEMLRLCNLLGIETIGALNRDVVESGSHRDRYLKELVDRTGTVWIVSPSFLVILVVILQHAGAIVPEDLTEGGQWGKEIAERVLQVAKTID